MLRQGSLLYGSHFSSCITSRKLTFVSFFFKNIQFSFSWGVISLRREITPGQYSARVIILLHLMFSTEPLSSIRFLTLEIVVEGISKISDTFRMESTRSNKLHTTFRTSFDISFPFRPISLLFPYLEQTKNKIT